MKPLLAFGSYLPGSALGPWVRAALCAAFLAEAWAAPGPAGYWEGAIELPGVQEGFAGLWQGSLKIQLIELRLVRTVRLGQEPP
ncbi:MAG TPA: hypothetical protein VMN36_02440 [Verrucomicrobiales bacterium]|nr:hypothetical protein [Verrucomicrobiales bacterium]